jgi:uncharacterized protein YgiB involved in biofilm formation
MVGATHPDEDDMKRSRHIHLVLLGGASMVALAACDQPDPLKEAKFFRDTAQCETEFKAEDCKKTFEASREQHVRTAPKFKSIEECQAQFGVDNCFQVAAREGEKGEGARSGGSWFLPLMMGYMMGKGPSGFTGAPVYRDARNTAYSGNRPLGRFDNASLPPPKAAPGTFGAPNREVARGGFGRTGATAVS